MSKLPVPFRRALAVAVGAASLAGFSASAQTPTRYSLRDGPLVCVKKLKEKLGANAQVSSIFERFFTEAEISDAARHDGPPGGLDACNATYQNPADPRKLLKITLDPDTQEFGDPEPIRLTVIGDAEHFRLGEILFPIAKINIEGIEKEILARQAALGSKYSKSQFVMFRIKREAGYAVVTTATFSGLLKSNDISADTDVNFMLDGRTY